jgi:hypothetical protein
VEQIVSAVDDLDDALHPDRLVWHAEVPQDT